jgi:hypothetical protein
MMGRSFALRIDCAKDVPLSTSRDDIGINSRPHGLTTGISTAPVLLV